MSRLLFSVITEYNNHQIYFKKQHHRRIEYSKGDGPNETSTLLVLVAYLAVVAPLQDPLEEGGHGAEGGEDLVSEGVDEPGLDHLGEVGEDLPVDYVEEHDAGDDPVEAPDHPVDDVLDDLHLEVDLQEDHHDVDAGTDESARDVEPGRELGAARRGTLTAENINRLILHDDDSKFSRTDS